MCPARFPLSLRPNSILALALAAGVLSACGSIESQRQTQPERKQAALELAEPTATDPKSASSEAPTPPKRTDAQIQADALLDHAVAQIQASLEGLESVHLELEKSTSEIQDLRGTNIAEWELAKERMTVLREGFREASSSGQWPTTIAETTYEREDLVQEASANLMHEQTLASLVATQDTALAEADKALSKLGQEIIRLRKELAAIDASRAEVNWDDLSPMALESLETASAIPDIEPAPVAVEPAPPKIRLGRGQHE